MYLRIFLLLLLSIYKIFFLLNCVIYACWRTPWQNFLESPLFPPTLPCYCLQSSICYPHRICFSPLFLFSNLQTKPDNLSVPHKPNQTIRVLFDILLSNADPQTSLRQRVCSSIPDYALVTRSGQALQDWVFFCFFLIIMKWAGLWFW